MTGWPAGTCVRSQTWYSPPCHRFVVPAGGIPYAMEDFQVDITRDSPSQLSLTFSGTPEEGQTWGLVFDGITSAVIVDTADYDEITEIVEFLATDIGLKTSDYTTSYDGETLVITE